MNLLTILINNHFIGLTCFPGHIKNPFKINIRVRAFAAQLKQLRRSNGYDDMVETVILIWSPFWLKISYGICFVYSMK